MCAQYKLPYRPQLAELAEIPPTGPGWVSEIKLDGYRIAVLLDSGRCRLESRRNLDWTVKFKPVAEAALALPVKSALIDGEVVILRGDGLTDFQALQNTWRAAGSLNGLSYFAFDLLELEGRSLLKLPLLERKRLLAQLIDPLAPGLIRYSAHLETEPATVLSAARKLGAEGIVCKRSEAPYHAGRHRSWVKVKCVKTEEFIICGFTEPAGSRTGVGGLILGRFLGESLVFRGSVGTGKGWDSNFLAELRKGLDTLRQPQCPFPSKPPIPNARWVRPALVCEVGYVEVTSDGSLRHPTFKGFRPDKLAADIREEPST